MTRVSVQHELETGRGWAYRVVVRGSGVERSHEVSLSWVDHDHIGGGTASPASVVLAVVESLLEAGVSLPSVFDVSSARRWFAGLDEAVRSRLGAAG